MKNRVTRSLLTTLRKSKSLNQADSEFLSIYYHRLSGQDYEPAKAKEFLQIARHHRKLGEKRLPGECIVELSNHAVPGVAKSGIGNYTHIFIVQQDRAFIIDSLQIKLSNLGKTPYRTFHPLFAVTRNASHKAVRYGKASDYTEGDGSNLESYIHLLVDHIPERDHATIIAEIYKVLDDIVTTVDDWASMKDRAHALATEVENTSKKPVFAEYGKFFHWMAEDNFAFLGYCELTVRGTGKSRKISLKRGSPLGVLRTAVEDRVNLVEEILPPVEFMETSPVVFTKSRSRADIHRSSYMDCILFNPDFETKKKTKTVYCILGFLASATTSLPTSSIPHLRSKAEYVLKTSSLRKGGYAYKELRTILETLPRDKLFQMDVKSLYALSMSLLNQERRKARLHVHRNVCGHFYSCLVYVPRDVFNSELRLRIQEFLAHELDAREVEFDVFFSHSILTRIHFIVHVRGQAPTSVDQDGLEKAIQEMARNWNDNLLAGLCASHARDEADHLFAIYRDAFPANYRQDYSVEHALDDISRFSTIATDETTALLHTDGGGEGDNHFSARFRVTTCNHTLALSDVLPILENMGIRIHSVRPYKIVANNHHDYRILDFEISRMDGQAFRFGQHARLFEKTFIHCWLGEIENDGYNQLTLLAGLSWRRISMIRAYYRYLKQIRLRYSENYIIDALTKNPDLTAAISSMFGATFDPRRKRSGIRKCRKEVSGLLEQVSTLDEERIIRALLDVIAATVRTNYFQPLEDGNPKSYISIKLSSQTIPRIPEPAPLFEIFVYSPRVEGVHLRGGKVARGGLRWSERPEDFRTEVLGLVKAQRVKNAVIVPVGSKGGFVAKQLPDAGPEQVQDEVIQCYRLFISGLLDVTDNISGNRVIPPENVVRLDEDDPYLVVAADKGTATFSDIANGLSEDYGFWLGDAFASGGSAGYDHKKMGITARGAWESVKRHFRELDKDIQNEPFTAVGIGDMAGDVFGNGMLLSRQTRLLAAFNHRHIFIDPDPDPATSYAERLRLFKLPRSAWTDYDPALISRGGGVFERSAKSIKLSSQAQQALGIKSASFAPDDLINQLLKADVELLWNGGIGTYVKSTNESHSDAQDRNNDAVRVNARELRCNVIGEGGNLGMTQLGRIEYCEAGGKCYTDAIDNSAGVDTSDHEVNIKILLNSEVRKNTMDVRQRNRILAKMENEVGRLVLANNYQQTQAISMEAKDGNAALAAQIRALDLLEGSGLLDREIEFLPDNDELERRLENGEALSRPELSVLLSYSKMDLYQKMLDSNLPDDRYLDREIEQYFPALISREYPKQVHSHRLKREIVSTQITNDLVGTMGTTFHMRIGELTSSPAHGVAAAYVAARDITGSTALITEIQGLDNKVPSKVQMQAIGEIVESLGSSVVWLLRHCPQPLPLGMVCKRHHKPFLDLSKNLKRVMKNVSGDAYERRISADIDAGLPRATAEKLAAFCALRHALDIIDISLEMKRPASLVAEVYFSLSHLLDIPWMNQQIRALKSDTVWHDRSRFSLGSSLRNLQAGLTASALGTSKSTSAGKLLESWAGDRETTLSAVREMTRSLKNEPHTDASMLSVLVGEMDRLS